MSYNLLKPVKIISAGDMSVDVTSAVVEIALQDNVGIQLAWTGDAAGTFAVEVSMDYLRDNNGNVINAGTWTQITISPAIVAAGSDDHAYIDLNQLSAPYLRVVYTANSGSGALNGSVIGKGV